MNDTIAEVIADEHGGLPLIRLRGEVDMSNADALGSQVRAAAGDAATVILDLRPVTFFDSQGLRMLQSLSDGFGRAGRSLVIVVLPAGVVGSILALTGMDQSLDVRATLP